MSPAWVPLKAFFLPLVLLANAFFAASETALTSLSGIALAQLKARSPHLKRFLDFWERHPDRVLATIILGGTLATVLGGVLAASIGEDCARLAGLSETWLVPAFSAVMTAAVFLLGEALPKILGRHYSERLAGSVLVALAPLAEVLRPVAHLLARIAGLFVRVLGAEPQNEIPVLSPPELQGMLETGTAAEAAAPARRILKNILEFGRLRVEDIQKPLAQVTAVDLHRSPREVIAQATRSPYSRIPVYEGSLDNIRGIIYAKDLLTAWRTEGLILIPDLLRPVYSAPQTMRVSELLREFKQGRHHFAVVRDEAGKAVGIVTIEDILEELVGKVYDESRMEVS